MSVVCAIKNNKLNLFIMSFIDTAFPISIIPSRGFHRGGVSLSRITPSLHHYIVSL